jgi:hypothetical protein
MNDQSMLGLGVVALIAFIVAIGVWAARARRRIAEAWAAFARAHNLQHTEGERHVRGEIDGGRTFVMFQDLARTVGGQARRKQRGQVAGFVVRVELASDTPEQMGILKKGLLDGASPITTGDPAFDKNAYVQCPDADAARAWLQSQGRRDAILEAITQYKASIIGPVPDGTTHDGEPADRPMLFRRYDSGYKPRLDWFEARFEEFSGLARRIDEA